MPCSNSASHCTRFDYDVLKERAGKKERQDYHAAPQKLARNLLNLTALTRKLTSINVLVCDEKGPLSIAGVMGGAESEVYDASKEVLGCNRHRTKT